MAGTIETFVVSGEGLQRDIPVQLWSPERVSAEKPLPLLIANDGPEYDSRSHLTGYLDELMQARVVPLHRIALVEPVLGARNNWYAASREYNRALAQSVLTSVYERVSCSGPTIGVGASLGAISMLGCEYQHPGTFGGLFLQSGSFHHPRFDGGTGWYPEYNRVAELVHEMSEVLVAKHALQVAMTCGRYEHNLRGNEAMAAVFVAQGHVVSYSAVEGGHDFESWGQAFTPHLRDLLNRCWVSPATTAVERTHLSVA